MRHHWIRKSVVAFALAVLLGVLPYGVLRPLPALANAASFTGTWQTVAGGTHEYTVVLKQVGNKVTGHYYIGSDPNSKINIIGKVTDKTLAVSTFRDGLQPVSSGQFVMAPDGNSISGKIGPASVTASFFSR